MMINRYKEKFKYLKLMQLFKSFSNKFSTLVYVRQTKLLFSYRSSIFRKYGKKK